MEKGVIVDIARLSPSLFVRFSASTASTAAEPETVDDLVNSSRDSEPVIPLAMVERGRG